MFSEMSLGDKLAKELLAFDYVFVDTCSLMEDAFPIWMDEFAKARKYMDKSNIYVPYKCFVELKKHSRDRKDAAKKVAGKRALRIIRLAKWHKLLTVTKKDRKENFADNAIYVQISKLRLNNRILAITQDKKLATDLRNLNNLLSQNGQRVVVMKITEKGTLAENRGEDFRSTSKQRPARKPKADTRPNQKPINGTAPSTKAPATKPTEFTRFQKQLIASDSHIAATIANPTISNDKKVKEIQTLLSMMAKLTPEERTYLPLVNTEASLNEALSSLKAEEVEKPAVKQEPKKEQPKAKPQQAEEKKEQPKAEPAAASKEEPKGFHADGPTLKDAIVACSEYYHIIYRAPSVAYFAQVHGPVDMTSDDLVAIVTALTNGKDDNGKVETTYKSLRIVSEKKVKGYRVSIELIDEKPNKTPAKQETKKTTKSAKPKENKQKEPAIEQNPAASETPAEPQKPAEEKKKAKPVQPKTPRAPKAKKPEEKKEEPVTETPSKPTLIVAVPEEKPKRKAKAPAPKPEPSEAKPEEKEAKTKQAAAKLAPVEKPKKASTKAKAEPKAEEPKPEAKPQTKQKAPAKKKEPAQPAEAKKSESPELKNAKKAEKRLRANVPNPNYPVEQKRADILAQIELVKSLKEEEQKALHYDLDALQKLLASLETK